jgi:Cro/C1-type HTH DNA-binding domain
MRTSSKSVKSIKSRKAKPPTPLRKLVLRVRSVMVDHGFRSVTALQRSLAAIGVAISVPQLIRVVDGDAKHLNKDVIEGLLTIFDCGIGDLFAVR